MPAGFSPPPQQSVRYFFPHELVFKGLATGVGILFVLGGEQHAGGVLIEPMDQKNGAVGRLETARVGVVASFKGGALWFGGFGIGMREHAMRFVYDEDLTIFMQNGTGGGGVRGAHEWPCWR